MQVAFGVRFRGIAMLMLLLLCLNPLWAHAADAHWVESELAAYKQRIVPFKDGGATNSPITKEAWSAFSGQVLDARHLDEPIDIANWATMVRMGVQLPKGQEESLIKGYVNDLAPPHATKINRETAVGGLIKLLTLSLVSGNGGNADMDARKVFEDFAMISDMQQGLVQTAYQVGLLDSNTKTKFRPKEELTNAEAVSMMEKVMRKYADEAIHLSPPTKPGFPYVVTLLEETPIYGTPDASLEPNGALAPQDVRLVAVQPNWLQYQKVTDKSWFLVSTWLGDQWIQLQIQQIGNEEKADNYLLLEQVTALQDTPYSSGSSALALSPQKVHIIALWRSKFSNSYLIDTWVGPKWITLSR
ncbi:hypothetical protein [Paenibacillus roseipurpureus]|uniref:SLH domain-containing protein n=1 Tax=Paenibacillus roseopurpureus TaxID=2918901 RepID=A0AA96LNC2_9BACL|nr:hypothetical protein [Paenibacillus sp. MBLB1832]WNR44910.1 hypothetical protein MJB10_01800 [Paenibacillus sp. MBLB1832]